MPDIGVAPCKGAEPCKVTDSVAHRSGNQCNMRGKWEATLLTQLTENIIQDSAMSINLGEHIITTTEDKVRLACMTHLKRTSEKNAWVAPASILLSIVVVFVTADFKEALGFPAATWRAVFMIVGFWSLVSTIRGARAAVRAPSVDEFVNVLKATSKI
jgi:hypothetical protein